MSAARIALPVMLGVLAGLGGFTFDYGEGGSYFSTDPTACTNCHIMQPQYDSWQKSSHHSAATCVDCHLPHDFFAKYVAKADNGYRHSKAFTFDDFDEPIRINARNSRILQKNCMECHADTVHQMTASATTQLGAVNCVHCHQTAGHGEYVGLGGADRGETMERLP